MPSCWALDSNPAIENEITAHSRLQVSSWTLGVLGASRGDMFLSKLEHGVSRTLSISKTWPRAKAAHPSINLPPLVERGLLGEGRFGWSTPDAAAATWFSCPGFFFACFFEEGWAKSSQAGLALCSLLHSNVCPYVCAWGVRRYKIQIK